MKVLNELFKPFHIEVTKVIVNELDKIMTIKFKEL